jgi:NTE family protein
VTAARLLALGLLAAALSPAGDALAAGGARPKVGLVLGGGGARGGAHLGVLEVLEEMRVPFDCVAGTSMGAIAAGAYAAGVAPAEIRSAIARTDWTGLFDDSAGRDAVSLRRKEIDDRFYSGLEFGVTREGLRYREGAVAGEKIKLFFNALVRGDLGERRIERLALPLTLIATDIGTGERVAMRDGSLTSAMRASMSVPGAIAPVVRDGRKLVDGGLVDNLPVQEVRDRCGAEVVIAVNVGSPLLKPEEVTGVISVVGQVVNLLTEQNVAKSLALLGPRDVYIRPELGDITGADFNRQLDAAEAGRAAALAAADRLRALAVSPEAYKAWRAGVRMDPAPAPPVVDEVRIARTRFVNAEELRASIRQREGEPLDSGTLEKDLVLVHSRGDLTSLDYSVLRERDRTILQLTPIEKSWGPDYLRFGLNLSSDFRAESPYNLRALYRRTWLNAYGGEWLTSVQLGNNQGFATEYYQPLDLRQRWFVRPFIGTSQRKLGLFLDGDRLAEYRVRDSRAGLELGTNLDVHGQARVGWLERRVRAAKDTGDPLLPDSRGSVGGLTGTLALDSQDFAFFPTRGYRANLDYFEAFRQSSLGARYGRVEGSAGGAWSPGDLVLLGTVQGGRATRGTLPLGDAFALGGQGRLSAFAPGQILGTEAYGLLSLQAQYRLTRPLPVLGLSVMAGFSFETGYMRDPVTEPNLTGAVNSYGLYLASNTVFGPMYLGYGWSKERSGRVYLFIGTP